MTRSDGPGARDRLPAVRILHLVGRSHHRGAELVALELARELERFGHSSSFWAVGPGHEGGTVADLPVLTGAVRQSPLAIALAAARLRRAVGVADADVILAHGGSALQVAVLGGRRRPVVNQLIMGMPVAERGRCWRWWWRLVFGRTVAIISLTPELTAEVRALAFEGPVELIPNTRSSVRFDTIDRELEAGRLRSRLGLPSDAVLVGFVGHFVDQKRPDVAVEVVAALAERGVEVHLVMAGEGPRSGAVKLQVGKAGLAERVHLLGHVSEVEQVLGGIDLLILTSDGEGMPGVAIEAQMAGCPVVSFPVGGVAAVVANGETGLVLASHEVTAMADAVSGLLADRERLDGMGRAARLRAARFSMAVAGERYRGVLEAVVDGPG
jgi:glycosyltransferase involved in cell wall biosynthesis